MEHENIQNLIERPNFTYDENQQVVMNKSEEEYRNKATELEEQKRANEATMNYQQQRELQKQIIENKIGALDKNHKWYKNEDSQIMKNVKDAMRNVIKELDKEIPKTENGLVDFARFEVQSKAINAAYDTAITACDTYIREARAHHSTGIRRKNMVRELRKLIIDEKDTHAVVYSSVGANAIADLENCNRVSDLYSHIQVETLNEGTEAVWQDEGNSTDVYRVETATGSYYVKENLKLIGADLDGYLDRRINELNASLVAKQNNDQQNMEKRLANNSEQDYTDAINVLQYMKNKLITGSGEDQANYRNRYIAFFGHDFCKIFEDLAAINAKLQGAGMDKDSLQAELTRLEEQRERASADEKKVFDPFIKAYRARLEGQGELRPYTEFEYIKELINKGELGLDKKKDKDFISLLGNMNLAKLFTRSLGKEVELYGQQKERGKVEDNDKSSMNNMATGRIAGEAFSDVITSSKMSVLKMKRKGAREASDVCCTMTTEAPGIEMLDVVKEAQDTNKTIAYSKNAVKQLIRLQMFDTACLQTDRHWRNFKVQKHIEGDKIIIDSLKSYDHDMSFGLSSLKDAFEKGEAGMLPPLTTKVKVGSFEHMVAAKKGLTDIGDAFLKNVPDMDDSVDKEKFPSVKGKPTFMNSYSKKVTKSSPKLWALPIDQIIFRYNNLDNVIKTKDGSELPDSLKDDETVEYRLRGEEGNKSFKKVSVEDFLGQEEIRDIAYNKLTFRDILLEIADIAFIKYKDYDNALVPGVGMKDKKDIEPKNMGRLMFLLRELRRIYETYDFVDSDKGCIAKYYSEIYLGYFAKAYDGDVDAMNCLATYDREHGVEVAAEVEIPTMLHMDEDAYNSLVDMRDNFDLAVEARIADLGWSQDKKDAFRNRLTEYIAKIDAIKLQAEAVLEKKYAEGDARRKFFLSGDDYNSIEDISEIAWNPGMSYFATEDRNILYGQEENKQYITEGEMLAAKQSANKLRTGNRQRLNEMDTNPKVAYKGMVGFKTA